MSTPDGHSPRHPLHDRQLPNTSASSGVSKMLSGRTTVDVNPSLFSASMSLAAIQLGGTGVFDDDVTVKTGENANLTNTTAANDVTVTAGGDAALKDTDATNVIVKADGSASLDDTEAAKVTAESGTDSTLSIGESFRYSPLAWIIHVADEAAVFMLDRGTPET